jgi:N-acetylglucosaminyl-diphospho-decaprenol L-rhamnosyltransferase
VARCLNSVQSALPDAEIIIVDNDSRDGTVSEIRAAALQVRLIENSENVGFGRACNVGAGVAQGSHVLFLNPDVFVAAADADHVRTLLTTRPFGLVAPGFEGEGDRRIRENSWEGEYFAHTLETLRPHGWDRRPRRERLMDRPWVSAGMLLVSRDEFHALGGFDPRFFLYYEDRDLSRRYRSASLPIRTTNAIRARHTPGTSSASDGLRAEPMAWSLLGWIQYVCIYDGERTARRAARATLATLRLLRIGMRALAALRWGRAQRKARQLDEVLRLVREHASSEDLRYCPDALRLIRDLA